MTPMTPDRGTLALHDTRRGRRWRGARRRRHLRSAGLDGGGDRGDRSGRNGGSLGARGVRDRGDGRGGGSDGGVGRARPQSEHASRGDEEARPCGGEDDRERAAAWNADVVVGDLAHRWGERGGREGRRRERGSCGRLGARERAVEPVGLLRHQRGEVDEPRAVCVWSPGVAAGSTRRRRIREPCHLAQSAAIAGGLRFHWRTLSRMDRRRAAHSSVSCQVDGFFLLGFRAIPVAGTERSLHWISPSRRARPAAGDRVSFRSDQDHETAGTAGTK